LAHTEDAAQRDGARTAEAHSARPEQAEPPKAAVEHERAQLQCEALVTTAEQARCAPLSQLRCAAVVPHAAGQYVRTLLQDNRLKRLRQRLDQDLRACEERKRAMEARFQNVYSLSASLCTLSGST
jgi:flagellar motility protein MotE (MotC chaperone)